MFLEAVHNRVGVKSGISVLDLGLGHNGHAVHSDELARGWLVGPSQVEQVIGARLTISYQVIILCSADHLAAMGDGLHVVLILVA